VDPRSIPAAFDKRVSDQIGIIAAIAGTKVLIPAIPDHLINGILEFLFQGHEFTCPRTAFVPLLCEKIDLRVLPGLVKKRFDTDIRF